MLSSLWLLAMGPHTFGLNVYMLRCSLCYFKIKAHLTNNNMHRHLIDVFIFDPHSQCTWPKFQTKTVMDVWLIWAKTWTPGVQKFVFLTSCTIWHQFIRDLYMVYCAINDSVITFHWLQMFSTSVCILIHFPHGKGLCTACDTKNKFISMITQ